MAASHFKGCPIVLYAHSETNQLNYSCYIHISMHVDVIQTSCEQVPVHVYMHAHYSITRSVGLSVSIIVM